MDMAELGDQLRRALERIDELMHAVAELSARVDMMQAGQLVATKGVRTHHQVTVDILVADGLSEQTAREWLDHRRRRKAMLTPRAWDGIRAEAAKAGWTIEAAVRKALARGWTGLEAGWLLRDMNGAADGRNKAAAALAKTMIFGDAVEIKGESRRV